MQIKRWDRELQETGHIYRCLSGQGSKVRQSNVLVRSKERSSWSSCCLSSVPVTLRSFLPSQKTLQTTCGFPSDFPNLPPLLKISLGWTSPFRVAMGGATQPWERSVDAEGPPSCGACVLCLQARLPQVMRSAASTPLVPGHDLLHAEDNPWLLLCWTCSSWSIAAAWPPLMACSCPFSAWAICCPWESRTPPCLPLGGLGSCAAAPGSSCAMCPLSCLQCCCEQDRSSRRSRSWGDQTMWFRTFPAR